MLATIENMGAHYAPGVIAYSPTTGEEFSANPADYWHRGDEPDFTLTDAQGNPMLLVRRETTYTPLGGVTA